MRGLLDLEKTVAENVTDGGDYIEINGRRHHVMGWLQDFMFAPERARTPVKSLSGGERNRLLLAKLFTKPANVLVLDEPTNDLDIETLEMLEELLANFDGTLLVVSHDRAFLDQVATSIYVFEGNGHISEYVGGYSDYVATRERMSKIASNTGTVATKKMEKSAELPPSNNQSSKPVKVKMSYKETRELEALPAKIAELETLITNLTDTMQSPDFYQRPLEAQRAVLDQLTLSNQALEACFERWEILEKK